MLLCFITLSPLPFPTLFRFDFVVVFLPVSVFYSFRPSVVCYVNYVSVSFQHIVFLALPAFHRRSLHVLLLVDWRFFASRLQKSISVFNLQSNVQNPKRNLKCTLCSVCSVFIVSTGTLHLPWLTFFRAFSSVVRKMPGYNSQKRDMARTVPNLLCCSVYCLCVNVYCTTATGCQPNCS